MDKAAAFAAPQFGSSFGSPLLPRPVCPVCETRRISIATQMALGPDNLLVVGAGVLGRRIGCLWRGKHPSATIVGENRSDANLAAVAEAGMTPALVGSAEGSVGAGDGEQFSRVVFCAPPSGSEDYAADVAAAAARTSKDGIFVFTSSTGIYTGQGPHTEDSYAAGEGVRGQRSLDAEREALRVVQGRVVRLSGLYTLERGAHNYFLKQSILRGHPDSIVSQIHYDDAAALVVTVLSRPEIERRIFLGCDRHAMTRQEILATAVRHPLFSEKSIPSFDGVGPVTSKTYDNFVTRRVLEWQPKYESFAEFIEEALVSARTS